MIMQSIVTHRYCAHSGEGASNSAPNGESQGMRQPELADLWIYCEHSRGQFPRLIGLSKILELEGALSSYSRHRHMLLGQHSAQGLRVLFSTPSNKCVLSGLARGLIGRWVSF